MDQLANYRKLIMRFMTDIAAIVNRTPTPGVETLCAFDEKRDLYLLLRTGWSENRRVRGTTLFVRLREGKIWVEEDWTEDGIATELVNAGVPKEPSSRCPPHDRIRGGLMPIRFRERCLADGTFAQPAMAHLAAKPQAFCNSRHIPS
jgi:hypothetical protein